MARLIPVRLLAAGACLALPAWAADAATVTDPLTAAGPGDVIDPAGEAEEADQSFGTAQATLEARPDLAVLRSFPGFSGNTNVVAFTDPLFPDIEFVITGDAETASGNESSNALFNTSAPSGSLSAVTLENDGVGSASTLTIRFGTFDGGSFTADRTVDAAAFTLANVFASRSGEVTFLDDNGVALNTAFAYAGVQNGDAGGNHEDFYFGWDADAEGTAAIASIEITIVDASGFSTGFDDLAFTVIPEPASLTLALAGLGLIARRRRG